MTKPMTTHDITSSATGHHVPTARGRGGALFTGSALIGGAVSVALGTYARVHTPTGERIIDLQFSSTLAMKAWIATGVIALVVAQLISALWMFDKLPRVSSRPTWLASVHRWSGTAAFLLTLPVAYHCLWSLGFRDHSPRVLVHSIAGCAFYGAIATKLLTLRSDRMPGWAVPLAGAALVTTLTAIWLTSALWFFTSIELPVA